MRQPVETGNATSAWSRSPVSSSDRSAPAVTLVRSWLVWLRPRTVGRDAPTGRDKSADLSMLIRVDSRTGLDSAQPPGQSNFSGVDVGRRGLSEGAPGELPSPAGAR